MSNEKQQKIVEMAKDICRVKLNCNDVCNPISACDALKYAERAVEAGYSKPEWISVEERLPEKDGEYLTFNGLIYYLLDFNTLWGMWNVSTDDISTAIRNVTHWMPLPEAPKGGAQK